MPLHRVSPAVFLSLIVLLGTGCITAVTPAVNTTAIQDVDFSKDLKKGSDCALMVLLFGRFGDASLVNAAKKAGSRRSRSSTFASRTTSSPTAAV
jgi:hypothetical protein